MVCPCKCYSSVSEYSVRKVSMFLPRKVWHQTKISKDITPSFFNVVFSSCICIPHRIMLCMCNVLDAYILSWSHPITNRHGWIDFASRMTWLVLVEGSWEVDPLIHRESYHSMYIVAKNIRLNGLKRQLWFLIRCLKIHRHIVVIASLKELTMKNVHWK